MIGGLGCVSCTGYMYANISIVTGCRCTFCIHAVVGESCTIKIFLTHNLVLSPGLLYVDTVFLGLLLCLYIRTCNALSFNILCFTI